MDLQFGHNWSDVPSVRAAWGARWIFPCDQVHDRTDCVGSDADREELLTWLCDVVGRKPFEMAANIASLMTYDSKLYVLYEDEAGKFVGHPHGGSGYLYVRAWLKKHEAVSAGDDGATCDCANGPTVHAPTVYCEKDDVRRNPEVMGR